MFIFINVLHYLASAPHTQAGIGSVHCVCFLNLPCGGANGPRN